MGYIKVTNQELLPLCQKLLTESPCYSCGIIHDLFWYIDGVIAIRLCEDCYEKNAEQNPK